MKIIMRISSTAVRQSMAVLSASSSLPPPPPPYKVSKPVGYIQQQRHLCITTLMMTIRMMMRIMMRSSPTLVR